MHPTIRALLADASLRLTLLGAGEDGALEAGVSWAHGSDLADPTPFLDAGQVLLTTGTQFIDGDADPRSYVERLSRAGIAGLGFGTEVATAGTPPLLVAACAEAGLPLFEVPYEVPFIAIARAVADRVAAAEHARDSWALGAMRAIAFAALRPDGVEATLDELARQLDRSVVLFDTAGAPTRVSGTGGLPGSDVTAEAVRLLSRSQRSSSTLRTGAETAVLQTIGRRAELRGVLAVIGGGELDASDQTVVTSVVALVGLALEQGREVTRARAGVRAAAVQALLDGRPDLSDVILGALGESVPAGPLAVARMSWGAGGDAGTDASTDPGAALEASLGGTPDDVLAADVGGTTVVIGEPSRLESAIHRLRMDPGGGDGAGPRVGLSTSADRDHLARADREARAALGASSAADPVVRAADLTTRGVDWLLDRSESRAAAAAVLRPIAEDDVLLTSLAAWLEANGQTDPAARALGVHRHTLRARISTIERVLGRDLSMFEARTEAWIALRALRSPSD